MSKARVTLAGLLAFVVAFGVSSSPEVQADPPSDDGLIRLSPQVWVGEPTDEMNMLSLRLEDIANSNPSVFSGLAFSPNYDRIEVYYVQDRVEDAQALLAVLGDEQRSLDLISRDNSLTDLLDMQASAAEVLAAAGEEWISLGIDFRNDGLSLGVASSAVVGQSTQSTNELEQLGIVSLREEAASVETYSSRSDSLRFTMGSALENLFTGQRCSAGYPIQLPNGTRGVVTAGHCGAATWSNPGGVSGLYVVGAQYATTWKHSQAAFGDWQVISATSQAYADAGSIPVIGSDPDKVERYIYTASNPVTGSDSAKYLIVGMNFGSRTLGQFLCVSGSTSGNTCRYKVTETNKMNLIINDGTPLTVGHITVAISDQNLDGVADCGKVYHGDSGGSVWYMRYANEAIGYGTVTGGVADSSCAMGSVGTRYAKTFYFSQTSGIKAAYPTAVIGGFQNGTNFQ